MSLLIQFNRLHAFLLNLECLGPEGQKDAFMNEVMECGGCYCPPANDGWSGLFEISLHGVFACGRSEDEAIRNWIKAARSRVQKSTEARAVAASPLPFPNPRNHAEEIANAQATCAGAF